MKKVVLLLLVGLTFVPASAQRSYMVAPNVAVFEPEGFDASQHLPSPIFKEELCDNGKVPDNWDIFPSFSSFLGKSSASFETGEADLYGGGEVKSDLRRNDDKQFFWNTDNPTGLLDNGKRMYQSHPWILGLEKDGSAFGIIADNTWKSTLNTSKGVRFVSEGPAFRVVVIKGDSPEEVIRTLAGLSGTMELPPLWSLGYQQSRYSYHPQEQVMELADRFRKEKIPCDVIWMDIHYMDKYKIFTFDPEEFSNPEMLNSYLHDRNFKAVYMIDPGVKAEEGYFPDDEGVKNGYFVKDGKGRNFLGRVWPGDCHFPDFTNPEVRKWWSGLYKDFMAKGIDGVWNDMNEPSVFVDFGGTMPKKCCHTGGDGLPAGSHLRYHNVYGYYMVKASREGLLAAKPDKRPFILSRSNFLGGQKYAATWTGDNFSDYSQMKVSVPMTLNMGLSCQAFCGPDIGGFMRDCTPDLLRHWIACGVYFPFARNHSSIDTANQEPFAFDETTTDVCRTAIQRRYRLLPYLYTLFEESSRTGLPVMRPVFWSDPKDLDLRSEQQAFLLGNDLLVIPRWCESPSLPKGDWDMFSFESGDDGYQAWLALRPGAAIPVTDVIQSTKEYATDSLSILINPGADGKARGTFYEDEGDGFGYRNGDFGRYTLSAVTDGGKVKCTIRKTEGESSRIPGHIRIGLVCDGNIFWSGWSDSDTATIDVREDKEQDIKAEKLPFVKLLDGSISKRLTKMELIMSNIVK